MNKNLIKMFVSYIVVFSMIIGYIPSNIVFASDAPVVDDGFNFDLSIVPEEDNGLVDVSWDKVEFKYPDDTAPPTNYYLVRHKVDPNNPSNTSGEYKWQIRGNYDLNNPVKVLNIYPDVSGSDGLSSWINNLSSNYPGLINVDIDKVSISDFNSSPTTYLSETDGVYNYNVLVFGFWDSNNRKDLTTESAELIQEFIDADGGVFFGHDTVQYYSSDGTLSNPNFSNLIEHNMNIMLTVKDYSNWCYSDKIKVTQQSTLTTYPFDIFGKSLIIPRSHTIGQFPLEPSDIYMTFDKNYYDSSGNGPYYEYNINSTYGLKDESTVMIDGVEYIANAYLMLDGNIAFIQCGHSSGKTNEAEQMILVNTIYALNQVIHTTNATDIVLDAYRPTAPIATNESDIDLDVDFSATDQGCDYIYRVVAAPRGASVSKNWDSISQALNNSQVEDTWFDDEGNQYAFSSISTQSAFAGLKDVDTYEYYIDEKPLGEKREGDTLDLNETFTIPTVDEGLTEDTYLHIWSYDKANNFSAGSSENTVVSGVAESVNDGITNIKLYDLLQSYNFTEQYQNQSGDEIDELYSSTQKYGGTFIPNLKKIPGYMYVSSTPEIDFRVDSDKDLIHYYAESLARDVYAVKHERDVNGNDTITPEVELIASLENITGSTVDYAIPTQNNYEFMGYTISSENGTISNNDSVTDGTNCSFVWNSSEPVYLHYDAIPADVTVDVKDTTNGIDYGSKTYNSYLGKTITIADIASSIPVKNNSGVDVSKGYVNASELEDTYSVLIKSDNSDDINIDLSPREKNIIYYGIEYPDDIITETRNTSGRAIEIYNSRPTSKVIYEQNVVFDGQDLSLDIKDIPNNKISSLTDTTGSETEFNYWEKGYTNEPLVDFSNTNQNVFVPFYKGNLPDFSYKYDVNYLNIVDDSRLQPSINVVTSTKDLTLIDVPNFEDMVIGGYDDVDFIVDHIKLTDQNDLTDVKTFGEGYDYEFSEFYSYFPKLDEEYNLASEEYTIDIYYRPSVKVTYDEYLTDTNGENAVLNSYKKFTTLWGVSKVYQRTFPEDAYEIIDAKVDGVSVSDPDVIADNYEKLIEIYYRPKTYDLTVNVLDKNDSHVYFTNEFNDISIINSTIFNIPTYESYKFDDVASEDSSYVSVDDDVLEFKPIEEGSYTIDLMYKQDAKVKVVYAVNIDGDIEQVKEEEKVVSLGDTYEFELPNDYDGYVLNNIYVNGQNYNATNIEDASYTVDSLYQVVYLIYRPTNKSNVVIETNIEGAGTTFGEGEYYNGTTVTVGASANEGYKFTGWSKVSGPDVTFMKDIDDSTGDLNETSILEPVFEMPKSDIVLCANFIKDNDITDNKDDDDDDDINIIDETIETDTITPDKGDVIDIFDRFGLIEAEKPVPPSKPLVPSQDDIDELIDNEYYEIIRMYYPYIQGYPDGLIQPESEVTRAEVVVVIYNLFGNGYVSDNESLYRYSDIDKFDWYADEIAVATDFGIVSGYSDGTFRPDDSITRAELSSIISKFIRKDTIITGDKDFNDVTGHWAESSILKLIKAGIINGYSDGTFKPDNYTTRAEFVTLTNRLIGRDDSFDMKNTYPDLSTEHWAYIDMMNAANGADMTMINDSLNVDNQ